MNRSGIPSCSSGTCKPLGCKELADRGAGAAECRVFLDGHDGAGACRQCNHKILVEGFHEAHVDERGVEALGDFLRRIDHCLAAAGLDTAGLSASIERWWTPQSRECLRSASG
jgi:DNA-directed RNA polymerase subunit RPC12/RpoP